MTSKFVLPEVESALKSFVYADKVKEILSLSFASAEVGKPLPILFYGRGGHGKSEMVRAIFEARKQLHNEDYGIQSFGEGMSEYKIYGGINLKALNCPENPREEFFPDRSFLNKRNYLFEELFDAPPVVLLSLKDTLTSKQLNNGHQSYEMKTLMLIAATNKNPAEIAEMGSSYEALVERFPLQVSVEWDSYKQEDFYKLFMTADSNSSTVSISPDLKKVLAGLIADAHSKGQWISPRQAMVCLSAVRASATIQGRREVKEDDLWSIKFIPGTDGILDDLEQNLERVRAVREATEALEKCKTQTKEIAHKLADTNNNSKIPSNQKISMFVRFSTQLEAVEKKIGEIRVPDSLTEERDRLKMEVVQLYGAAFDSARKSAS